MPTVANVAVLVLQALIDELGALRQSQIDRIAGWHELRRPSAAAARLEALRALADADRLDLLEPATERLAAECARAGSSGPVRAAAYDALLALIASDLLPHPSFRALYEAWDEGTNGGGGPGAVLRGEEVLFRID
jgi:hypothetical protein